MLRLLAKRWCLISVISCAGIFSSLIRISHGTLIDAMSAMISS